MCVCVFVCFLAAADDDDNNNNNNMYTYIAQYHNCSSRALCA